MKEGGREGRRERERERIGSGMGGGEEERRNDQNQLARLQRIICFAKALLFMSIVGRDVYMYMYTVWHIYTGHCTAHA